MMQEYSRNYENGKFEAACDLYDEHNSTVTWTNGRNGEKTKDEDTRVGKEDIKDKFKWLWSVGATKLKYSPIFNCRGGGQIPIFQFFPWISIY